MSSEPSESSPLQHWQVRSFILEPAFLQAAFSVSALAVEMSAYMLAVTARSVCYGHTALSPCLLQLARVAD